MPSFYTKTRNKYLCPGGYKCKYCGPVKQYRKKHNRTIKRGKLKQFNRRIIEEYIDTNEG
jgi:hypothetical protein